MTNTEKQQVYAKLIKEKEKLEEKIKTLVELTQPISPDCSIGRVSRMDAINNKSVNEAALRTAREKMKNVLLGIEKFDSPDFGKCRNCGKSIPFGRLMVMPGSSTCVSCAGFSI
jgi:DnaK suppressor protein